MATANNSFDGMFSEKSVQEIERSLRAHRGALTKITCYIGTAVYGYDALIELEPQDEKRFLEKKKEIIDIAVKSHARIPPAIARCHNPVTAKRVTQDTRDPQVKIREGLKPDRLKMDFTPVEFRKWKSQITTFFQASNLQYATQKEQHGYLHMCLDANLTNHVNVNMTTLQSQAWWTKKPRRSS